MVPGEYFLGEGDIDANAGRATDRVTVANTGDRPIQVGSHFHFFEANKALSFDRARAWGMRLEPGDEKVVPLVALGGAREVHGLTALADGKVDEAGRAAALARAAREGYL